MPRDKTLGLLQSKNLSRRKLLTIAGASGLAAFAGCAGQSQDQGKGKKLVDRSFVSGLQREPNRYQYNWYHPNRRAMGDESIVEAFWAPLIQYHSGKNKYVADLVKDWSYTRGESFTIELRDGLKWWDGKPVTVHDIVAQKTIDKHVFGDKTGALGWIQEDGFTPKNDKKLTVDLSDKVNQSIFIESFAHEDVLRVRQDKFSKYLEGWKEATTEKEKQQVTQDLIQTPFEEPFGYGSWKIEQITPQKITATQWDGYWASKNINYPKREFIPTFWEARPSVQKQALAGGKLDGAVTIGGGITEAFMKKIPGDPIFPKVPAFAGFGININHAKSPFDDSRVRQALSWGIDHKKLATIDYGHEVVKSKFSGMSNYYYDEYIPNELLSKFENRVPRKPEKALSLLMDAGFTKNSNGKLIQPNGKPFSVELKTIGARLPWARIVAENLSALGMDVQTTTKENSSFFGITVPNGDFKIALWSALGWKKHHPHGDFTETWLPSGSLRAQGTNADLTPSVPWPPGNKNGTPKKIDIKEKINEIATSSEERTKELVVDLAWVYHMTTPSIRLTERHLTAMVQRKDWNVTSKDDPDMLVPTPVNWLPKVGDLKAEIKGGTDSEG